MEQQKYLENKSHWIHLHLNKNTTFLDNASALILPYAYLSFLQV